MSKGGSVDTLLSVCREILLTKHNGGWGGVVKIISSGFGNGQEPDCYANGNELIRCKISSYLRLLIEAFALLRC